MEYVKMLKYYSIIVLTNPSHPFVLSLNYCKSKRLLSSVDMDQAYQTRNCLNFIILIKAEIGHANAIQTVILYNPS